MKKRFVFLLIISAILLVSCASANAPSNVYDVAKYEKYMIPTSADVVKLAREEDAIHFWFMSNLGSMLSYININGEQVDNIPRMGDCTLVVFPDGTTMLIDCGLDGYAPILALNLERLGIKKLDYIVLTHQHDDHVGALYCEDSILNYVDVGQIYWGGTYNTGSGFSHLGNHVVEKMCKERGIPYSVIHEGDTLMIGDVRITVINPPKDSNGKGHAGTSDINCNSIVMRFDYKNFSALFTGDIYAVQEAELVKKYPELLDVDLLKIPHHGRPTSSTQVFAEAVTPKVAVAMGHYLIEKTNYSNYTRVGSKVLFDYADGYIHVWSDGVEDMVYETSLRRKLPTYDLLEYGSPYLI